MIKIRLLTLLWIPVILVKIVLALLGLVLVPITSSRSGMYRRGINRPNTYWERAIRNPVGGFGYLLKHPKEYGQYGVHDPDKWILRNTDTRRSVFRWRWSGWMVSYRRVWKHANNRYSEIYIGWKLGSAPDWAELDFAMQYRRKRRIGQ